MTRVGVINDFRGDYAFLSNFYVAPFVWRRQEFQSGEQAFAFAKITFTVPYEDMRKNADAVLAARTPKAAKAVGRRANINVEEWDKYKVAYMRELTHAKFSGVPGLAGALINTGATMLVEGNTWGDQFWGRTQNPDGLWTGLNVLGVILMEERGVWSRGTPGIE